MESILNIRDPLLWIMSVAVVLLLFARLYPLTLYFNSGIRRVTERYAIMSEIPHLDWVWLGATRWRFAGRWCGNGDCLYAADCGSGLYLKREYDLNNVKWVNLPVVLIPRQFVKCVDRSKYGFFDAQFTVSGFKAGELLEFDIKSTDVKIGKFIVRCAATTAA